MTVDNVDIVGGSVRLEVFHFLPTSEQVLHDCNDDDEEVATASELSRSRESTVTVATITSPLCRSQAFCE